MAKMREPTQHYNPTDLTSQYFPKFLNLSLTGRYGNSLNLILLDYQYGFHIGDLLSPFNDSWSYTLQLFGESTDVALNILKDFQFSQYRAPIYKLPSFKI